MLMTFCACTLIGVVGSLLVSTFGDNDDNKVCDYTELNNLTGDGIKISKNIQLSTPASNEHILMLAPSGSGKSRRFVMPNVNSLGKCSIVVTDPSGEIERTCHPVNKKKYIFSPFNSNTVGYDPLVNCRTEFEVRKIAGVILDNGMCDSSDSHQQEWVDMAKPLFTSFMLYNWKTKKYSFNDMIYQICTRPIVPETKQVKDKDGNIRQVRSKIPSIVEEVMASKYASAIIELQLFLQVMGADRTVSSVRIVMNTCLQMFMAEQLDTLFTKNTVDLRHIRDEECTVYIQIPERHSEYYKPLVATFVTQLIDCLLDNHTGGLQTYLIFDEFCNIGKIPNICSLLSTARKYGVSIVAAIQNITQLTRRYGEIDGKELQELFKTILVCGGLKDSAEHISRIAGKKKIVKDNITTFEDILPTDKIRCMLGDDILVLSSNKRPVMDKMLPIVI